MSKTSIVTGASSGFGAITVRHPAEAGHIVYRACATPPPATPRPSTTRGPTPPTTASTRGPVEMDVADQASVDAAVATVLAATGLDVVVHDAGHMVLGPTEAFTPEQLAAAYDINLPSTQRVNRATWPHLRAQRAGPLIWVGSSSARGETPYRPVLRRETGKWTLSQSATPLS